MLVGPPYAMGASRMGEKAVCGLGPHLGVQEPPEESHSITSLLLWTESSLVTSCTRTQFFEFKFF